MACELTIQTSRDATTVMLTAFTSDSLPHRDPVTAYSASLISPCGFASHWLTIENDTRGKQTNNAHGASNSSSAAQATCIPLHQCSSVLVLPHIASSVVQISHTTSPHPRSQRMCAASRLYAHTHAEACTSHAPTRIHSTNARHSLTSYTNYHTAPLPPSPPRPPTLSC